MTPLSPFNPSTAIASVDQTQHELIGLEIAQLIISRLGHAPKAHVDQMVIKQIKEPSKAQITMTVIAKMAAEQAKVDLLTPEQKASLQMGLLWHIKDKIKQSFSTPTDFIQQGVSYQASDYEPAQWITDKTSTMGIELSQMHIPSKYHIDLTLDQLQSEKKSELVFKIEEQSDGVIFQTTSFALSDLSLKNECPIS